MKKRENERFRVLNDALHDLLRAMHEDSRNNEVDFCKPTLTKIAKSDVEISRGVASLKLIAAGKGSHTPLYFLGLKEAPKHGSIWMANIRTARIDIDVDEYLRELGEIVAA